MRWENAANAVINLKTSFNKVVIIYEQNVANEAMQEVNPSKLTAESGWCWGPNFFLHPKCEWLQPPDCETLAIDQLQFGSFQVRWYNGDLAYPMLAWWQSILILVEVTMEHSLAHPLCEKPPLQGDPQSHCHSHRGALIRGIMPCSCDTRGYNKMEGKVCCRCQDSPGNLQATGLQASHPRCHTKPELNCTNHKIEVLSSLLVVAGVLHQYLSFMHACSYFWTIHALVQSTLFYTWNTSLNSLPCSPLLSLLLCLSLAVNYTFLKGQL